MIESSSRKPRVALVFGGRSGEHQISCATAASVMAAIDRSRYEVLAIGITREGEWVRVPARPELFEMVDGRGAEVVAGESSVALWTGAPHLVEKPRSVVGERLEATDLGEVDVIFPLLHGAYGEDGTIQGLMEMSDVRYVGCGVAASAVSMDKHFTKSLLLGAGIAVGRWTLITDRMWNSDRPRALAQAQSVGQDLYVKPSRAGSSLGISHVENPDDLEAAIEYARKFDPRVVVEAAVSGREIECGVLDFGNAEPARASRCGEIAVDTRDGFYDYKTKYQVHDAVTLTTPANLPREVEERIRATAVQVFEVLGAEGLARVDFFYDEEADAVIVNEVNTLPGFTPWSMYPAMWEATGISYPDLVTHLIERALARPLGLR
ncbi:MAG: D-alanine--D-alanine ligase family protein [Actinomycetaceae bacterium]|nr:D-alanine--D-alanine ligase family protein [Actinomycetaceae bacterium]